MLDHIRPQQRHARLWKQILLYALLAGLPACNVQSVKEGEEPAAKASGKVAALEETIGQQEIRIMQLELQLLAKTSEIQRLSSTHEQAIQEIVRLKSKLRSRNSKAETVANLAEVKLALQGAQAKGDRYHRAEGLERARQYVAMSEAALEERNYDGASYLIGQAKYSLRTSMAAPGERPEGSSSAQSFSLPIQMTVTQRSNVRMGPGTDTKVVAQLSSGASVSATGYRDLWVRIHRKNNTNGWIHYSLLKADL